jgi:hypothetical protein
MERYEEDAFHKAGVGANLPRVQRCIIWMRAIMAAANFSPAVASRRAKYDGVFRVSTLFVCIAPRSYRVHFANAPRKISTRYYNLRREES